MLTGIVCAGMNAFAQSASAPIDSVKTVNLEEIQVTGTRATAKTPVAHTDVGKEQLRRRNTGVDIPFLLTTTPSVITTSDAGAGIGYTGIRIRGTDATRINVTANGIPMNDAESHSLYWVDIPDIASSLEDIQVQRGAGTSTNGAGAFGGSINMRTQGIPDKPYAEIGGSYGSYNTHKETVKVGSGLLHDHWAFEARLSDVQSDGYRDRASSNLKSYFLQGGYYAGQTIIKFITFSGKEKTYHAWDGITKETMESDRKYNPNGEIKDYSENPDGVLTGFYSNQVDVYKQTHYQLLLEQTFNPHWNLTAALHYTRGTGYYEEYKNDQKMNQYLLQPFETVAGLCDSTNLVRRKFIESHFAGGVFSLNYHDAKLEASLGGGANYYVSDNYGRVIWTKNYLGALDPDHEYYSNKGKKADGNIYAKANYNVGAGVSLYADLQYRYIRYKINGNNDVWDDRTEPQHPQRLAVNDNFSFFNPKAGVFWQINPNHSAYASFAVAQKEPTRNNYTDGLLDQYPKSERMFDYELGYTFRNSRYTAGANLYYMDYTNQLVLSGKVNQIGEPMSENVKDSYRMGIELTAGAKLLDCLRWDVNATWSKNRIKNYTAYYSFADDSQTSLSMGTTPIAFSPSLTAGSLISFDLKGWEASLQSQYVSRQYLDNTGTDINSLDAYFVNNLHVGYSFDMKWTKGITVGATVYNLFNEKYETNGYSYSTAAYDENKHVVIGHCPYYYPMAGTNVLANVTLRF